MKRNAKGQFVKGSTKGNSFAKGNPPNATSFKKGNVPSNRKELYAPREVNHSRDGVQVITTISETKKCVSRGREYTTKKRINYARVVVGLENIPKGYIVWHIDRNPLNNNIDNLEIITRAECMLRNSRV